MRKVRNQIDMSRNRSTKAHEHRSKNLGGLFEVFCQNLCYSFALGSKYYTPSPISILLHYPTASLRNIGENVGSKTLCSLADLTRS